MQTNGGWIKFIRSLIGVYQQALMPSGNTKSMITAEKRASILLRFMLIIGAPYSVSFFTGYMQMKTQTDISESYIVIH